MKQTTKVLSLLLALLMAFSVTAIAADALTVTAKYGDADLEGATVPAGDNITLAFSNNVTDSTVYDNNTAKIKVKSAEGAEAAVTYSAPDKNTIVVTLPSDLAKGAYTLTLGKDVKAKNGTTLGEKKEFSFTVKGSGSGTGGGNNPLSVKSVLVDGEPLEGKELEAGAKIVIRFDRGMVENFESNKTLVRVTKADGTDTAYSIDKNNDKSNENAKREYIVTLGENEGGAMTLIIGADVKANNGNTLGDDYAVSFSFKAAEEAVEPDVEPANPTILDRVKLFVTNILDKIGYYFKSIVGCSDNCAIDSWLKNISNTLSDLFAKLKQFDLNVQLFLIQILIFLGLVPMLGGFEA